MSHRCRYVDRTLAFPSSCLLCYHQRCRSTVGDPCQELVEEVLSLRLLSRQHTWAVWWLRRGPGACWQSGAMYHRRWTWRGVRCSRKTWHSRQCGWAPWPPSSAWSLVGCAVFMGGHLSKSKRVSRRVVASSRNQVGMAGYIQSFLIYSEHEDITVVCQAFRDIDWLISPTNHDLPHRSYRVPSSSTLNYIGHLKFSLSTYTHQPQQK